MALHVKSHGFVIVIAWWIMTRLRIFALWKLRKIFVLPQALEDQWHKMCMWNVCICVSRDPYLTLRIKLFDKQYILYRNALIVPKVHVIINVRVLTVKLIKNPDKKQQQQQKQKNVANHLPISRFQFRATHFPSSSKENVSSVVRWEMAHSCATHQEPHREFSVK